ncbi:hypothetical protein [Klebsiella pneumoniae]|uniref:hypothetical protein n=1 Tax=Klebsiella pneumoniae TaxID=573 RepID=UPI000E347DD9|nr:hypothetical protein [Klebsiella pneumoniae]EKV8773411.1 hypothetical protein [Klebsiella variicola]EKW0521046.1 hypothetical protein [Klebsiella variicola]ELS0893573.1 hypothetical protein [Raoultella ornithinolytica]HEJ0226996.1 hypothetical protein [Klebsiella pneumoniae]
MKATARKKSAFKDLLYNDVFSRVIATRTSNDRWQLCGVHRNGEAVIFVMAARGGIREWSSLEYLADFCDSIGVEKWEVHRRKQQAEELHTQPVKNRGFQNLGDK